MVDDTATDLRAVRPALPPGDEETRTGFRAGGRQSDLAQDLGLLQELQGNWRGHGFNLTARPFFTAVPPAAPFFLELNATVESLNFTAISGDVPNRGSFQKDIFLHGLHYLQQVTDVVTDTGIHIENGMWMRVPASDIPKLDESYVRHSTIPHGDSLIAQTVFTTTVNGGPLINPVFSAPFFDTVPAPGGAGSPVPNPIPRINDTAAGLVTNPAYLDQYLHLPLPPKGLPGGLTAAAVIADPTLVLKEQIKGQNIIQTVVLSISTTQPGLLPNTVVNNLINIPYVTKNANATQLDAIFWIELVERPNGRIFVQVQYVQRVILKFLNINWPHISVATLKRI